MALLRLLKSLVLSDATIAKSIGIAKKSNLFIKKAFLNPKQFFSNEIKHMSEQQINIFKKDFTMLLNQMKIKKRIISEVVKSTNIDKFRNISQKFKQHIKVSNEKDEEFDNDQNIEVVVYLSSSAIEWGMWVPIFKVTNSWIGNCTIKYINGNIDYVYPNVSRTTWIHMCQAKGTHGTGANSVFIREYQKPFYSKDKSLNKNLEKKRDVAWNAYRDRAVSRKVSKIKNISQIKGGWKVYGRYKG